MAQHANLRASDEDRERVAERLRRATAEGRLLAHELEERLATALRARTYGELESVVADLPGDRAEHTSRQTGRSRSMELAREHPFPALVLAITVGLLAVAVVTAIVISMMVMWGVWMLVAWLLFGRRHALAHHYRHGPRRPGRIAGQPRPGLWL